MAFQNWLSEHLNNAGIDGDVYGEYIGGALDSMGSDEHKGEAILEILESYVEDSQVCKSLCKDILTAWEAHSKEKKSEEQQASLPFPASGGSGISPHGPAQHQQPGSHASQGGLSSEEKKRLLAQYGCESDEEETSNEARGGAGLYVNRNATVVSEAGRMHREKLKVEHEARAEKIKVDKERQKQKAQERKEKEKKRTQKQEKRR